MEFVIHYSVFPVPRYRWRPIHPSTLQAPLFTFRIYSLKFIDLLHKNMFLNPVKCLHTVTISYFVRKRNTNIFIYGESS